MERILIVDDNVVNCNMLADVLQEWGYTVAQAYQGKEVVPLLERFAPHLILLDVMLPGINGFEICRLIKSSLETEHIAVILLTALNDVADRMRGVEVGADLFLSRPTSHKELRCHIESILDKKRKLQHMEYDQDVCALLVDIISLLDPESHQHTQQVRYYSRKTARILGFSEDLIQQVDNGAAIHDFGKLLTSENAHWRTALAALQSVKLKHMLEPYLFLDREADTDVDATSRQPVMVVSIANRFCRLLNDDTKSEDALQILQAQHSDSEAQTILNALKQVVEDDLFLDSMKLGNR